MVMSTLFASYIATSKRLGLAFEDGRAHGVVDGVALQMWFGMHAVHIGGLLPRTAPLDLSVATKGLIDKLGDLFGSHADGIGDPAFDAKFAVKSSSPTRVGSLLGPDVRRLLIQLEDEGYHPAVDSTSVHLRRFTATAASDSEETVEYDLRATARLALAVSDSIARHSS